MKMSRVGPMKVLARLIPAFHFLQPTLLRSVGAPSTPNPALDSKRSTSNPSPMGLSFNPSRREVPCCGNAKPITNCCPSAQAWLPERRPFPSPPERWHAEGVIGYPGEVSSSPAVRVVSDYCWRRNLHARVLA